MSLHGGEDNGPPESPEPRKPLEPTGPPGPSGLTGLTGLTSPAGAEEFRAGAVPAVSLGLVMANDTELLPAVLLDATTRPDVADLARVHDFDGIGDLRCGFGACDIGDPEDWLVRFDVAVDHPVMCRFHTVVSWSVNTDWLDAVAAHGAVALGTQTSVPPTDLSGQHSQTHTGNVDQVGQQHRSVPADEAWLVVNVDPTRLAPVLDYLRFQALNRP